MKEQQALDKRNIKELINNIYTLTIMNNNTTTQEKIICSDTTGFFDGLASVRIKINQNIEKWGVISREGEILIPFIYDYAGWPNADTDFLKFRSGEECFYLNRQGERVLF